MVTAPCPCHGCRDGRHSNGKICRWCEGKGYVADTDWPKPCWEGHYSGDLPPVHRRRGRHVPRSGSSPHTGSTPHAARPARPVPVPGGFDERGRLGGLLAGRWLVRVESAGGVDLQDAFVTYVPHGASRYRVVSRGSGGWADGTWTPLNGSQISVDARLGWAGMGTVPFRPTITFEVVGDGSLRATADGVRMTWVRQA